MAASLLSLRRPSWACSPALGLPEGWAASPDSPSTRCFGIPPQLSPSLSGCVELCAARGSTPACIRSAAENDVAATLIGDGVPAWLGLYQHDTSREPVEGWGRCVDGIAPRAISGAFYVYGGSGKSYDLRLAGVKCSNRLIRNEGTGHTFNVRSMGGNSSDNFSKQSGAMLQNSGTWTMNLLDSCADIGVDASLIARNDGTIFYNTNAALGTLGAAGLVVGQGVAANSWHLMAAPLLVY